MNRKRPMRRIILGTVGTVSAVVLLLALKQPGGDSTGVQAGSLPPAGGSATGGQEVLGAAADTQFGPVQVQLTVSGGRIVAANAVKAPTADPNSRKIAADALPKLNQAVVTAQSAQIDAVSGASYTSKGYITSLQSAIDKAGPLGGAGGTGAEAGAQGPASGADADAPPAGAEAGAPDAEAGAQPGTGAEAGSGGDTGAEAGADPGAGSDNASGNEAGGTQTVLGDVTSTQYGDVQVRITVNGGRVTAADAVKAPDSDANSRKIAANAVPKLNQAAVTAQNAQIDAVSGASYTSKGYITSLQSALDKAGL